jgi:thiamine biosynthesis lipoprotein
MATRFEVVLHGDNPIALRAAAEEVLREIQRLHDQLSLYSPTSEISFINAHAAHRPVQVEPRLFQLLQRAQRLHQETEGAFDITIAPLIRCWGFMGGSGALPTAQQIEEARCRVGMQHVLLDEKQVTIQFARPGMMLDLGSIGKGYALEEAVEILKELGIGNALIHGGTSTVCALGSPPGGESWKVAVDHPGGANVGPPSITVSPSAPPPPSKAIAAIVSLQDEALSVSAVHGKSFRAGSRTYGHVIDPRTGEPAQGALLAAVAVASATESDAFSTALLLSGCKGHDRIADLRPGMRTLVLAPGATGQPPMIASRGIQYRGTSGPPMSG